MSATDAWNTLSEPWQVCLDEAWQSWCHGSAGVGAVIVDDDDAVVSRGRNRRHDPRPRHDMLSGTRLAHAEMCALAELPPGTCEHYTMYTTFEPCLMCTGAIMLARIPRVWYAAADPVFDGLNSWLGSLPFAAGRQPESRCLGGTIGTFAHVLHVSWLVFWFPDSAGIVVPHRSLAPRHLALAADLVERSPLPAIAAARGHVTDAIDALWDQLEALA